MSILFHWPESLKIETSIKEQNQHNIEDTLVNLDFLKKCSGTIHVSYESFVPYAFWAYFL